MGLPSGLYICNWEWGIGKRKNNDKLVWVDLLLRLVCSFFLPLLPVLRTWNHYTLQFTYNSLCLSTLALVQHHSRSLCLFYTAAHRTTRLVEGAVQLQDQGLFIMFYAFVSASLMTVAIHRPHRCFNCLRPLPGSSYGTVFCWTSTNERHGRHATAPAHHARSHSGWGIKALLGPDDDECFPP